ncbi:E1 [Bos taurus papillomavirus 14]|uniref:Replication protein E1 n=1 Tax=Bos taurus papillomavirus 14 TaxID=2758381 RepID=A0A0E3SY48_BPV1|nr:E1 [Bos taurus papillomavirus 14]
MAEDKGSWDSGVGCSFLLTEADCVDSDKENQDPTGEELSGLESDTDSQDADFVDNASVFQGNHLELFQTLEKKAGDEQILKLKRKLVSSSNSEEDDELSPRLAAVTITPKKRNPLVKRRLFETDNEANRAATGVHQVQTGGESSSSGRSPQDDSKQIHLQLLKAKNVTACKLSLFKTLYVCSFHDLTRLFKNDKTTNLQWVAAAFGVLEVMYEASFELLKKHCSYLQMSKRSHEKGTIAIFLLVFNHAKSRETVSKLLCGMLNLLDSHLMLQPPKIRGVCSALFWFKNSLSPATLKHGTLPEWIRTQTMITECLEQAKFDFGTMVQWAYDNKFSEESKIAYEYAIAAENDANARAFLASSSQAKYVKDCATMVRHYLRAEVQALTISAYIKRRCELAQTGGSWLSIMNFLKYQGIEPIRFVNAVRPWLKGVPKKNCIAFIGPPNTGKSMFSNSFISFLGGCVLSFANHKSHFWLASLADTRAALIDDATHACWRYFDTYLRNALDGYPVSIDRKHKTAVQIKAPPLVVTSNIDVLAEERYFYLHSRLVTFYFNQPCGTEDNGELSFNITNSDWKIFFERLWGRLELSDQEDISDSEDGSSLRTLVCSARCSNATN